VGLLLSKSSWQFDGKLESFFSITRTPPVEAALLEAHSRGRTGCYLFIVFSSRLLPMQWQPADHALREVPAHAARAPCTPNFVTHRQHCGVNTTTTTTVLRTFFPGLPRWAGARRELLDFMVQGKIDKRQTLIIWLGATPSGLTSAHLHHPHFLQAGCTSCRPTNSVKALKATSTFRLGRRR